ncbi:MAG: uracil-DNA glycosylase [bacterium]
MPNTAQSIYNFNKANENLRYKTLQEVDNVCKHCYKCDLSKTRTNVVFGEGIFSSKIMLIGEGPGQQEDETGRPFIGKAGKFLDKLLESQEISREKNIYICNIVKCRPPENRVPSDKEIKACREYLDAQIQLMRPEIIILCGSTAVKAMLNIKSGITKIRGQWFDGAFGSKMMPLLHPSYLLRNQSKAVGSPQWLTLQDIQEIRKVLDSLNS